MSSSPPRAIGDLLLSTLPQLGPRLTEHRLRRAWPSLVGPDIARRARPGMLAGGTLTIVVDNSPWLHEMTLRSEALVTTIAARFAEVKSLRFTLGTLEAGEREVVPPGAKPAPLTDADRAEIDTATAAIADPTLAATARRVLTTAWRFPVARGH
jgi:hypothetical protein